MCHSLHYPSHGLLTDEVIPLLALENQLKQLGVSSERIEFVVGVISQAGRNKNVTAEELVELLDKARLYPKIPSPRTESLAIRRQKMREPRTRL